MITLICSLALLGFYMLYSTSKRAELSLHYKLQQWIKGHGQIGKGMGTGLLLASFTISILYLGWGVGIFSFIVITITVGSLVVLLSPLRFFNLSTLIIGVLLSFGIEFFLP